MTFTRLNSIIMDMAYPIDFSHLTHEERVDLALALWESLDEANLQKYTLTPEQERELDRRIDAEERGEMPYSSWEEVKIRLSMHLRK